MGGKWLPERLLNEDKISLLCLAGVDILARLLPNQGLLMRFCPWPLLNG
jgi:hypothetical protein